MSSRRRLLHDKIAREAFAVKMTLNNLLENLEMNLDMVRQRNVIRMLSRNTDDEDGEEKNHEGAVKMRNYFDEFCQNTSIHGMKYLTQKKRRLIGK